MDNIIFSANVVLPLLLIMLAGYGVRWLKWVNGQEISSFNSLCFIVFLPCLLFNNVRNSNIEALGSINLFAFVAIGTMISIALTTLIVPMIESSNARRGVMIQGIFRSNYSIFGIPLLTILMPNADIGVAAILIAIVIPMYNIFSVGILTYFGSKEANFKSILIGILKNPLILSTFAGAIFLVQGWKLPTAMDTALLSMGAVATPLSLFLLGASFEVSKLNAIFKQTVISVLGKLVIVPVLALTVAVLLGFRDVELASIMIVFASPTTVASFTMAEKLKGDSTLAAAIVLFTSVFCIFSLFFIILALKTFQFI